MTFALLAASADADCWNDTDMAAPMHAAPLQVVQLLLEGGAITGCWGQDGTPARTLASRSGHWQVAPLLLKASAATNTQTARPMTA